MVKTEMIANKQFGEITAITEDAVKTILGFELRHVGINMNTSDESLRVAKELSALLGTPVKEGNTSYFVGTQFEVMNTKYLGAHGHLAIGTNFIHRAVAHLERKGYRILHESASEKNGKLATVYLVQEIGGFAVHLLQR
jgi:2-dehydro-3-deoxyphosphogluconate aldolase/(4S)-4-hydroxy-2-oxoglutarate aldolase